jgi:hypothetical protein
MITAVAATAVAEIPFNHAMTVTAPISNVDSRAPARLAGILDHDPIQLNRIMV